ncbi:hypothetical protein HOH45_06385 [bacterium]|jgi:hypothetical protein|nr:hypothetical protein [bacterium]
MKTYCFALVISFYFMGAIFGMDFGNTSSELESLIEQSRLMQSHGKNDMEANLDAFQVMMLKQFFLKHLFSDEMSILTEEEQDEFGTMGVYSQQKSMMMEEFAKRLAEKDVLGIKKQILKEISSEQETGRY